MTGIKRAWKSAVGAHLFQLWMAWNILNLSVGLQRTVGVAWEGVFNG